MKVTDVRAVIAIGLRGQFGLRGRLPWEGNRGREYVADVERFFELTRGHVVIMGNRTFTSVPDFAFKDRDILEIHASDRPEDVLALSEPRRLHRRRAARLCRLCAFHPPLGHQPVAV
jgi:dihydromethanopterin reductase